MLLFFIKKVIIQALSSSDFGFQLKSQMNLTVIMILLYIYNLHNHPSLYFLYNPI